MLIRFPRNGDETHLLGKTWTSESKQPGGVWAQDPSRFPGLHGGPPSGSGAKLPAVGSECRAFQPTRSPAPPASLAAVPTEGSPPRLPAVSSALWGGVWSCLQAPSPRGPRRAPARSTEGTGRGGGREGARTAGRGRWQARGPGPRLESSMASTLKRQEAGPGASCARWKPVRPVPAGASWALAMEVALEQLSPTSPG